jgi:hypothetical protein
MTNSGMEPIESKKFIRILLWVSLIWLVLGIVLHWLLQEQVIAFIQIFLFSFLDLCFLLLIFWELFYAKNNDGLHRVNKARILVFLFFKLVCLGFLAITLKRLRNASFITHLMGVSIIWFGPWVAGLLMKHFNKIEKT